MPASFLHATVLPEATALVTLDQAGSRANVLSQAAWGELENLLTDLETRHNVRGLIVESGKPGMFVAGADLKELANAPGDVAHNQALCRRGLDVLARLEALPYPTVALIDGPCLGGGLELALACDYRLAGMHPKTELGFPEVKLGLIPGWGGTQRLPRLIGVAAAVTMICFGEAVKAEQALTLGLVNGILPSDQLRQGALALLPRVEPTDEWQLLRERKHRSCDEPFASEQTQANINGLPADQHVAALAALEVIIAGATKPLADALADETEAFSKLLGSEPSRRLIAQFFQSRRPSPSSPPANPS